MRLLRAALRLSFRAAARLVAPPLCASCNTPLEDEGLFCLACEERGAERARVDQMPYAGFALPIVSTGPYEGALARAVQRLKYGGRPDLALPLGERLGHALERFLGPASRRGATLLVPVPLHPRRLAERGYNQSALTADAAARAWGAESRPLALSRTRVTGEQAALGRLERARNVASAFAARERLIGRVVVIVDDVVTTGATALECANALTGSGATVVAIAAIARADRAMATSAQPDDNRARAPSDTAFELR